VSAEVFLREIRAEIEEGGEDWSLREEYHGRNFYEGPAVVVRRSQLQDVIRATSVDVQWDQMGKDGLVVYPVLRT
jgi:hypothetical protein